MFLDYLGDKTLKSNVHGHINASIVSMEILGLRIQTFISVFTGARSTRWSMEDWFVRPPLETKYFRSNNGTVLNGLYARLSTSLWHVAIAWLINDCDCLSILTLQTARRFSFHIDRWTGTTWLHVTLHCSLKVHHLWTICEYMLPYISFWTSHMHQGDFLHVISTSPFQNLQFYFYLLVFVLDKFSSIIRVACNEELPLVAIALV